MLKRLLTLGAGTLCLFAGAFAQEPYDGQEPYYVENPDSCCLTESCEVNPSKILGRIDVGAAYAHVDILTSGHTIHKMDMGGIRADAYYRLWKGLVIKPSILYTHGKNKDYLFTGGFGLGFCFPYKKCFCLTPIAGITWGNLKTEMEVHLPFINPFTGLPDVLRAKLSEKFRLGIPLYWI